MASLPDACSGDMYAGVPMAMPICVRASPCPSVRAAFTALAMPKSATVAASPVSRMLSGLISRWMIPRSCAYASALATSRNTLTTSAIGNSRTRSIRARSDSPSIYGMLNHGSPCSDPTLSTGTMCGCCSRANNKVSRLKRSTFTTAANSLGSTFNTIWRRRARSSARKTRDIPPPPSSRSSR